MSYDIQLNEPGTQDVIHFDHPHNMGGGTRALHGTTEAWLNITWNYGKHYYRLMGDNGIRTIYGLTGRDSIPILRAAIDALGDDVDADYWAPTEGNAKTALKQLVAMAVMRPDGVWAGD